MAFVNSYFDLFYWVDDYFVRSKSAASRIRTEGDYLYYSQDDVTSTPTGKKHITRRNLGTYAELGQDDTDSGATHVTDRTDGSNGVYGAESEIVLNDTGATVESEREEGSYGSGTRKSVVVRTYRGATVISDRDDQLWGCK